jgi:hypothetical protein
MHKTILAMLCAAGVAASFAAAAHDAGTRHMDRMDRMHEGTHSGPPLASRADENSNGRFAKDREFGLDRAAERRNGHAAEHERADDAQKARHRHADEPAEKQPSK